MSLKSLLVFASLVVGTQAFAANYNCVIAPNQDSGNYSSFTLEVSKEAALFTAQDDRLSAIEKVLPNITTPTTKRMTVYSAWTQFNMLVSVQVPTKAILNSAESFTAELATTYIGENVQISRANYICSK